MAAAAVLALLSSPGTASAAYETPDDPYPVVCINSGTPGFPGNDPNCDSSYADSWLGDLAVDPVIVSEGDLLTLTWTPHFGQWVPGGENESRYSAINWTQLHDGSDSIEPFNPVDCEPYAATCVLQVVRGGPAPDPGEPSPWRSLGVSITNGIGSASEERPFYIRPNSFRLTFHLVDVDGTPLPAANRVTLSLTRRASQGQVYHGETLNDVLRRYYLYQSDPAQAILAFGDLNPSYVGYGIDDEVPPGPVAIPGATAPIRVSGSALDNTVSVPGIRPSVFDVTVVDADGRFFEPFVVEVVDDHVETTVQAAPDPLVVTDLRAPEVVDPLAPFDVEVDVRNVSDSDATDVTPSLSVQAVPSGLLGIAKLETTPEEVPSLGPGQSTTFVVRLDPRQPGQAILVASARGRVSGVDVHSDEAQALVRLTSAELIAAWQLSADSYFGDVGVIPGTDPPEPVISVLSGDTVRAQLVVLNNGDTDVTDVTPGALAGAGGLTVTGPTPPSVDVLPPGTARSLEFEIEVSSSGTFDLVAPASGVTEGRTVEATARGRIQSYGLAVTIVSAPGQLAVDEEGEVVVDVSADALPLSDVFVDPPAAVRGDGAFAVLSGPVQLPALEPYETHRFSFSIRRTEPGEVDYEVVATAFTDPVVVRAAASGRLADEEASITIEKLTTGGPPGLHGPFPFSGDLGGFSLSTGHGATSEQSFDSLDPDTYTVSEEYSDGWTLTELSCTDPDGETTTDVDTATATIDLDAGEDITCTFLNAAGGSITIAKVVPAGTPPTDFVFNGGEWFGENTIVTSGQDHVVPREPGTYTLTELDSDGWTLTGLTCTDPDGETTTDLDTATATIDLDPGEEITCTFENTPDGSIRIEKRIPAGTPPTDFVFNGGEWFGESTVVTSGQDHVVPREPGTYTLTELDSDGWTLTGLTCTDPDGETTTDLDTATATIDLDPGEEITCTFENTPDGSITIQKQTVGVAGGPFEFSGDLGSFALSTGVGATSEQRFDSLGPGTYTVSEDESDGWTLTDLACTDPDGETTTNLDTATATIDFDAGEEITCVFGNAPVADEPDRFRVRSAGRFGGLQGEYTTLSEREATGLVGSFTVEGFPGGSFDDVCARLGSLTTCLPESPVTLRSVESMQSAMSRVTPSDVSPNLALADLQALFDEMTGHFDNLRATSASLIASLDQVQVPPAPPGEIPDVTLDRGDGRSMSRLVGDTLSDLGTVQRIAELASLISGGIGGSTEPLPTAPEGPGVVRIDLGALGSLFDTGNGDAVFAQGDFAQTMCGVDLCSFGPIGALDDFLSQLAGPFDELTRGAVRLLRQPANSASREWDRIASLVDRLGGRDRDGDGIVTPSPDQQARLEELRDQLASHLAQMQAAHVLMQAAFTEIR